MWKQNENGKFLVKKKFLYTFPNAMQTPKTKRQSIKYQFKLLTKHIS